QATITMDYESTGYQSNPSVSYIHPGSLNTMNGRLNPSNHNQFETHTNSSYPLPVSFQTLCGPSVPYSNTTNGGGPTDKYFGMIIYFYNPHVVMREERTRGYLVLRSYGNQ